MNNLLSKKLTVVSVALFAFFTVWWLLLQGGSFNTDENREVFSATYGLVALWGGILAFLTSKKWGSSKSILGKAVLYIGLGLLLQVFGQLMYSVYTYLYQIEIPYPSVGDIGFFGSIFAYILGSWYLATVVGIKYGFKSSFNKLLAILIPLFAVYTSYLYFVKDLELGVDGLLATVLNVGYPIGQSIYVAIAMVGYLLSRHLLGGKMRTPLSLLLLSLILQYCADFVFLYQTYHETWVTGGINEYMYLTAYFVMAMSLNSLHNISVSGQLVSNQKTNG